MNQKKEAFAQRLEINSRNYSPRVLFDMKAAGEMLSGLYEVFGLHTLMTDRLPARHCPPPGSRAQVRNPVLQGWYPNNGSLTAGAISS